MFSVMTHDLGLNFVSLTGQKFESLEVTGTNTELLFDIVTTLGYN
jgi:hypothetical protein